MDYKLVHDRTIQYIRHTDARSRLHKRSPLDPRLATDSIYIEIHHIIPRSLGGLDDPSNLVEVLPEEHVFLHMLRYKIYHKREDALAIRFMLNGLQSKSTLARTRVALTKQIRMGYAWIRTHAHMIRQTEGWHTLDGVRRISAARRGKMPVKHAVTGEKIGMVDVTHPNVQSGLWVHHSKGRIQSSAEIEQKRSRLRGQDNPNASGLTEDYFVQKGVEAFREFGLILSWGRMLELAEARGFTWIKSLKSRFGGTGLTGYYAAVSSKTGATFDSYQSRIMRPRGQPVC